MRNLLLNLRLQLVVVVVATTIAGVAAVSVRSGTDGWKGTFVAAADNATSWYIIGINGNGAAHSLIPANQTALQYRDDRVVDIYHNIYYGINSKTKVLSTYTRDDIKVYYLP
jgi:hypothetical protein